MSAEVLTLPRPGKPRLRLQRGVWHCWTQFQYGFGVTPRAAYQDWSRKLGYQARAHRHG